MSTADKWSILNYDISLLPWILISDTESCQKFTGMDGPPSMMIYRISRKLSMSDVGVHL